MEISRAPSDGVEMARPGRGTTWPRPHAGGTPSAKPTAGPSRPAAAGPLAPSSLSRAAEHRGGVTAPPCDANTEVSPLTQGAVTHVVTDAFGASKDRGRQSEGTHIKAANSLLFEH